MDMTQIFMNELEKIAGLPSAVRAGRGGSYGELLRRASDAGKKASRPGRFTFLDQVLLGREYKDATKNILKGKHSRSGQMPDYMLEGESDPHGMRFKAPYGRVSDRRF